MLKARLIQWENSEHVGAAWYLRRAAWITFLVHLRTTSHVLHVSEQLWLQLQQIFIDCLKTGSWSWVQDNIVVLCSECHLPTSWPVLSCCKLYNEFWCGSHKCWGAACGWKATSYLPLSVRMNLFVSYGGCNDIVDEIYPFYQSIWIMTCHWNWWEFAFLFKQRSC